MRTIYTYVTKEKTFTGIPQKSKNNGATGLHYYINKNSVEEKRMSDNWQYRRNPILSPRPE